MTELLLTNMKTSVQRSPYLRPIIPQQIQETTHENGMFRMESLCPSPFRGTWMCGDPQVKRYVYGWVGEDSHVKRCVGWGGGL